MKKLTFGFTFGIIFTSYHGVRWGGMREEKQTYSKFRQKIIIFNLFFLISLLNFVKKKGYYLKARLPDSKFTTDLRIAIPLSANSRFLSNSLKLYFEIFFSLNTYVGSFLA